MHSTQQYDSKENAQSINKSKDSLATMEQPSRTIVHAKLEMTTSGSQEEQEADAAADVIVNGGKVARSSFGGSNASGISVSPQMESQLGALQGRGQQMPQGLRSMMERGFGRDFSQVRLHTDSTAADMSSSIHAKAFTHGNDIYFNQGQFNPETTEGKRLVGHELAHVTQSNGKLAREEDDILTKVRNHFQQFVHKDNVGMSNKSILFEPNGKYKNIKNGKYVIDCDVYTKEAIRVLEGLDYNIPEDKKILNDIVEWNRTEYRDGKNVVADINPLDDYYWVDEGMYRGAKYDYSYILFTKEDDEHPNNTKTKPFHASLLVHEKPNQNNGTQQRHWLIDNYDVIKPINITDGKEIYSILSAITDVARKNDAIRNCYATVRYYDKLFKYKITEKKVMIDVSQCISSECGNYINTLNANM